MKAAAIQIGATPCKGKNYEKIHKQIELAVNNYGKFDLICLPELSYSFPDVESLNDAVDTIDSYSKIFSPLAREYNSYIVSGSFPEISPDGKIYNTCIVFNRNGEQIAIYRKKHLFDSLGSRESDIFTPGQDDVVFNTEFGPIGVMICFDLRFPDMYQRLVKKGAKVITVSAAFYSPRSDHFETLNRSLAMNTQCYVVAANQICNIRDEKKVFCGRSTIVDPWGVAIATASDQESFCCAYLDFEYQKQIKERLPL